MGVAGIDDHPAFALLDAAGSARHPEGDLDRDAVLHRGAADLGDGDTPVVGALIVADGNDPLRRHERHHHDATPRPPPAATTNRRSSRPATPVRPRNAAISAAPSVTTAVRNSRMNSRSNRVTTDIVCSEKYFIR